MRAFSNLAHLVGLAVAVAAVSLTGVPVAAQTLENSYDIQFPPPPAVPFMKQTFGDVAFVRDRTRRVVFTSISYGTDLKNGAFDPVDSLFGICYGGGYVSPLVAASAAGVSIRDYTITASSAWYQVTRNVSNFEVGPRNNLQNFANSWRDDLRLLPGGGMESHYDFATLMSPFTPPIPPKAQPLAMINYSIYASPDRPGGMGANNSRTLGDQNLGQPNQARQFVILVEWDVPSARHSVNILRLYDAITRELGVPLNRVVILFGNPAPAMLGPFTGPINDDPNGLLPPAMAGGPLRQAPVNGPDTRASWLNALAGKLFLDAAGKPIQPQLGDKLFIFHTGHGALFSQKVPCCGANKVTPPPGVEYDVALDSKYDLNISGNLDYDLSVADLANDGMTLQQSLQFSFGQMLPLGTDLVVNGTDLGPLDADLVSDPSQIVPIDPFITQPTFTYQLEVPQSIFTDLHNIDFLFTNSGSPSNPALQSLIAFDIRGGDQELLEQVVAGPDIAVSNGSASVSGAKVTLPLVLSNTGGTTANNVTISSVTPVSPATYAGPMLPVTVGNIAPGTTASQNVEVGVSGIASGSVARIQINGNYQDGAGNNYQFSSVRGMKLP